MAIRKQNLALLAQKSGRSCSSAGRILLLVFTVLCRRHSHFFFEKTHKIVVVIAALLRDFRKQHGGRQKKLSGVIQPALLQVLHKTDTEYLEIELVKIRFADIQPDAAQLAVPIRFRMQIDLPPKG